MAYTENNFLGGGALKKQDFQTDSDGSRLSIVTMLLAVTVWP